MRTLRVAFWLTCELLDIPSHFHLSCPAASIVVPIHYGMPLHVSVRVTRVITWISLAPLVIFQTI